jgi:hypothetical protein
MNEWMNEGSGLFMKIFENYFEKKYKVSNNFNCFCK